MLSSLYPRQFIVIIPCHNCEPYIEACLDSLLAQTFVDWKALVADDCSDDKTVKRARRYENDPRIRVRRADKRLWLMGNTLDAMRSLSIAPNDVVAILDGDDWIRSTCLAQLWKKHCLGYDLVYTDETIQGHENSVGRFLLPQVPIRDQLWSFSQLRSFKGYLFSLLNDAWFRDEDNGYYRAAGDLSLYFPMAEMVGMEKIHFIDQRLYYYRVHDNCNFKVLRQEQLRNNHRIRNQPQLRRQTRFFDFTEDVYELEKQDLFDVARNIRAHYPLPFSVLVRHRLQSEEMDAWRAYHGLWIETGVFLTSKTGR